MRVDFVYKKRLKSLNGYGLYPVKLTTKKGYAAIWLDIQPVPDGGQAPFKIKFQT
ncbi:hypothetical protein J7E52_03020 [Bacillus sp. ISL-34]|uniref:hypothetical protein n=1 Tax=Bacillus sp. ISL-34 TaxID=2819121 RepID=UPI001BEC65B9|nr:hypothetical protein [Bacillus sp. ISL-34]MBT2645702.1 hypothetical protein [Bacillus sp. ISL-34]